MPSSVTFSATISQPCQQSWDEMTPSGNGKHCGCCQKKVIDFSTLTDAEIVNIFRGASQKICGRFNSSQLNRVLDKPAERKNAFPAVVLTTLLVMSVPSKSTARPGVVPLTHAPLGMPAGLSEIRLPQPCDTPRIITGQLIDSTNKDGLAWATVRIKGTSYGAATDAAGTFRLRVPDSLSHSEIILVFASIGFINKELLVTDNRPIKMEMEPVGALMGDVVITCMRKATFRERVKAKWKRLWGK